MNFNNDEDHEDEFEHMSTKGRGAKEKPRARPTAAPPKTIKITNIPAHLRNNVGIFLQFFFFLLLEIHTKLNIYIFFFSGKIITWKCSWLLE